MSPRNAVEDGWGNRTYTWPATGETFRSVTTILGGGVPKNGLPYWAAKRAAEYAVANRREIAATPNEDLEATVNRIKQAPWAERDEAANKGTAIHKLAERYLLGQGHLFDAAEWKLLGPFLDFLRDFNISFERDVVLSEATVYSRRYGYAGTLDLLLRRGERLWMIDLKSGKGVYAEAALQCAAYAHADFIGVDGIEVPMSKAYSGAVLHLRPRSYYLYHADIGPATFAAFLSAMNTDRWLTGRGKSAIGPVIKPLQASLDPPVKGRQAKFEDGTGTEQEVESFSAAPPAPPALEVTG